MSKINNTILDEFNKCEEERKLSYEILEQQKIDYAKTLMSNVNDIRYSLFQQGYVVKKKKQHKFKDFLKKIKYIFSGE